MDTDIGGAYIEAYNQEKVCSIAGPEFGEMEGCLLKIMKALKPEEQWTLLA